MPIPKIIHQLWIGPHPPPTELMNTWKDKHIEQQNRDSNIEYIFWTENTGVFAVPAVFPLHGKSTTGRTYYLKCSVMSAVRGAREWCGKADIYRWDILYQYGGFFTDADAICIEPLDDFFFEDTNGFATFENEFVRDNLIAIGNLGFPPRHKMCADALELFANPEYIKYISGETPPWATTGPRLITQFLDSGKYADFSIFGSHCFLPHHHSGFIYEGHKKVYAYQEWSSTKKNCDTLNYTTTIPTDLMPPTRWVSLLVSHYGGGGIGVNSDCPPEHTNATCGGGGGGGGGDDKNDIEKMLASIRDQNGHFGIEIVWMDAVGGTGGERRLSQIREFLKTTRFITLYVVVAVSEGATTVSLTKLRGDILFYIHSTDVILPEKIKTQLHYMDKHPECVLCGSNVMFLVNKEKTNYPTLITKYQFQKTRAMVDIIHPSSRCVRKSALFGRPKVDTEYILETFGEIHNVPDILTHIK